MTIASHKIPCVILCGGKSSRMGEDKALLPFDSKTTLTQYQYDRLKPHFKKVYISSKNNKFDFNCNLIFDDNEIYSPIVALKSIFEVLQSEDKIFIITVDTPLVKIDSINKIIDKSKSWDICVAKTIKTHNLCGVFSKKTKETLDEMIDKNIHKVGYLLNNLNTQTVQFDNDDEFINLNNIQEYKKSLKIIS
jgi:molybdopterin-guanine dinucleotide biosynthesis protein A